jgi:hypothetical protein
MRWSDEISGNSRPKIPTLRKPQGWGNRQSSIAAKRNETRMAASAAANEFVGHGTQEKSKPRRFKNPKGSATRKGKTSSSAWTYWSGIIQLRSQVNREKCERVGHPRSKLSTASSELIRASGSGFQIIAIRQLSSIEQSTPGRICKPDHPRSVTNVTDPDKITD